ncbi:MAG: hypothetical protein JW861_08135 [Bacteroidales bacterium]|nr:hypothetical protein [Bacteroidales bacterium]
MTRLAADRWIRSIHLRRTRIIAGIILGAAAGYLYYLLIGCRAGTCPITSSPWMSTLWGAIMGYLLLDSISVKKRPPAKGDTSEGS